MARESRSVGSSSGTGRGALRRSAWTGLLAVAVSVAGCGDGPIGPGEVERITELPPSHTASERQVLDASNRFAFDLLRTVAAEAPDSNVFLSPLSASMALGMTLNGARAETFEQMRAMLGFGELPQAEINASYRGLLDLLGGLDATVDVSVANSIWYRDGFSVEADFLSTVRRHFDAEVASLDFADPSAAGVINAWVDRETRGKIPGIVDPPIDPLTMMFLINAVYFKAPWTFEFDKGKTRSEDFHRARGGTTRVPLMDLTGGLPYTESVDAQVVELPYGGGAYAMTVLLPREGTDPARLLADLDAGAFQDLVSRLEERNVELRLPRFKLRYEEVLNGALQSLGMRDAFDPSRADLSGINRDARSIELHVSKVKQKTFVEVNEEGTEAAAATSVEVGVTSCCSSGNVVVRVDRPFVVFLRERLSGAILFAGVVADPS